MKDHSTDNCFTRFNTSVANILLPKFFTFPFYYEPHELSRIAAQELQDRLSGNQFNHNFGIEGDPEGLVIGKMFGVLVVKNESGQLGYLSAFSGKLGNNNHHKGFVPPVYDMLEKNSFFLEGMQTLNQFSKEIEEMESSPDFLALKDSYESLRQEADDEIEAFRESMRQKKRLRKETRLALLEDIQQAEKVVIESELVRESLSMKHQLKVLVAEWDVKVKLAEAKWQNENDILKLLKKQRKATSNGLQKQLFSSYHFLNADGLSKDLGSIFKEFADIVPPSGAGECAAPKLLQYAFKNQLRPISMAEFWWGASPKSEVRKHLHFYPSCRGKCEPILGHMLQGLHVEPNPMLQLPDSVPPLDIVYEDDVLVVVNKPSEFLSVPGRSHLPSVYDQIKAQYPNATGPLVVHRLDMATSGILLFTKTKEANKFIQAQFIKKTIKKRYVALLNGVLESDEGTIDLPLRLDLNDRPRQLVCFEHGKRALTKWKSIERDSNTTRVHFFPITGRTHQLRVHAAHKNGLNTPIIGDDLYGSRADRLHLHAEEIRFIHPETRKEVTIEVPAPF